MNAEDEEEGASGLSQLAEFTDRVKYIPLRLTLSERKLLRQVMLGFDIIIFCYFKIGV